jgi:hypothetical protein
MDGQRSSIGAVLLNRSTGLRHRRTLVCSLAIRNLPAWCSWLVYDSTDSIRGHRHLFACIRSNPRVRLTHEGTTYDCRDKKRGD